MAFDLMSVEEMNRTMSAKNVSPKAKSRAPRVRKVAAEKKTAAPAAAAVAQVDVAKVASSTGDRPPLLARAEAARARRAKSTRQSKRQTTKSELVGNAPPTEPVEQHTRDLPGSDALRPVPEEYAATPRAETLPVPHPLATMGGEDVGAAARRRTRGRRGGRGRSRDKNDTRTPFGNDGRPGASAPPRAGAGAVEETGAPEVSAASRELEAADNRSTPSDAGKRTDHRAGTQDDRNASRRHRGRRGRGRARRDGDGEAEFDRPARDLPESEDGEASEEINMDYVDGEAALSDGSAREMMINISAGEECRIAILQDGRLEELFIERTASQSHVGNIYKGRVTNVEPSIQAAFIDFGLPKNGFLHISDVQPQYFPHAGESEDVGRKIPRHHRPPIQKCFRRGQEVIVQITKEGVGTKGPTLTTYLSIPGRFLVMMPGMSEVGVSRKIEDESIRRKMRDMLGELELPPGMGFILRTAGLDRNKRELQRDLHYLQRLWRTVVERVKQNPAPAELYRESDLVIRTIRDVYSADFKRVVVDDTATTERVREFLQIAMPRARSLVEHYTRREPLFHHFGIEAEIERINSRHVPLKSGGSLVIDSTEAMVAIDVNSGRFRALDDAEETAFKINVEAAEEIARQLRLRDLGGLIVCDFIDMRMDRHKRAVERALKDALRKHKERARLLRMSAFGLIEMTRQRQGPSLKRNIYFDCPHCRGSGLVKMPESVILDVIRIIQLATHHDHVRKITVSVASDVAYRILNKKRVLLSQIESETNKTVVIRGDANFTCDQIEFVCEDDRGQLVPLGNAIQSEPQRALPREAAVGVS